MVERLRRFKRETLGFSQENGREPTTEEIVDKMEMSIEKVRELMEIEGNPASLDAMLTGSENDTSNLKQVVSDPNAPAPDALAEITLQKEGLDKALGTLSPREEWILRLRFGLDDGKSRTLGEVGEIAGVTRERIRQIQKNALEKLRNSERKEVVALRVHYE